MVPERVGRPIFSLCDEACQIQSSTPPYVSHWRAKGLTPRGMTNFPSGPRESLGTAWTLDSCVLVGSEGAVFMFFLVPQVGNASLDGVMKRGEGRIGREAERERMREEERRNTNRILGL